MSSEFVNREFLAGYTSGPTGDGQPYAYAIQRSLALYRSVRFSAGIGRLWARVRRTDNHLHVMPGLGVAANLHSLGVKPVPIAQIRGSEGRSRDFDRFFRPIGRHTRERWVRIAALVIMGTYLPAIEVIYSGEHYYVRDGNHRVSVFRAMGVHFIDAHVTALDA